MEELKSSLAILGTCLCGIIYSHYILSKLPRGFLRIIAVAPVIGMYVILPWQLSTVHMRAILSFIFTWISSFKLLMLCFDVGPLANPWAKLNIVPFLAVSTFPVEVREYKPGTDYSKPRSQKFRTLKNLILKALVLGVIIHSYSFRDKVPQSLILGLYGVHMYLALDIILVFLALVANSFLGVQLEPQFDKPFLASSLRDFWGKRWNLIVTSILRPSVYGPVLDFCWNTHKRMWEKSRGNQPKDGKPPLWARGVALFCAFLVSGMMHELIFCCLTQRQPTWEVTAFFALHGLSVAIEVFWGRSLSRFIKLPKFISIPMTLVFVYTTGFWLFFPPLTRYGTDLIVIAELEAALQYLFPRNR